MIVKDLKALLDKFDDELPIYLQLKDERGWGIYNLYQLGKTDIALQDNESAKYIAFGDVLKKGENGICSFDGSKISG